MAGGGIGVWTQRSQQRTRVHSGLSAVTVLAQESQSRFSGSRGSSRDELMFGAGKSFSTPTAHLVIPRSLTRPLVCSGSQVVPLDVLPLETIF